VPVADAICLHQHKNAAAIPNADMLLFDSAYKGVSHDLDRGRDPGPEFKGQHPLPE